ncbi:MAG: hypothetical protein COU47_01745 [Candidatus Niyogibacteria bacterium CG10_big_fil_rev_8_21_14_0_10_46_36]|uniref:DUF458 domain-containing protein n=1 Tax=Candidatus Niyogibacteria bacterium CG10_big_fil_rev_8_21_14_0_10_46_36 TaxID=1974726 RepID=A0A2H0TE14_9BACT|nr:MAG: hypothetical protein COU47_01745 [Candidatus Niyogibacteria bacterium CG10_big_fil_rev_8_21_14_0_10_46_36]
MTNLQFHNHAGNFNFEQLVDELIAYIYHKPDAHYHIVVGSDSRAEKEVCFVTAVGILRIGNGGRYFWSRSLPEKCGTLQNRIFKETMRSIAFTQELRSALKDKLGEEFFWNNQLTVHLDVGENGPTRELIDTVVGMVKGYGFEAAVKPYSFGAFVLADRHT